jgi:hypothetical protein
LKLPETKGTTVELQGVLPDKSGAAPPNNDWTCLILPAMVACMNGMTGEQIRQERERRKLTQEQLAKAIGVGQRTIGNWERGETVPLNRMGRLRDFFGIDADESSDPIRNAPDVTLLAELLRRAAERGGGQ